MVSLLACLEVRTHSEVVAGTHLERFLAEMAAFQSISWRLVQMQALAMPSVFSTWTQLCSTFAACVMLLSSALCLQAKSTGQLSSATYAANFLGCLARIFTSYKEGGGASMVRGYILGMLACRCMGMHAQPLACDKLELLGSVAETDMPGFSSMAGCSVPSSAMLACAH